MKPLAAHIYPNSSIRRRFASAYRMLFFADKLTIPLLQETSARSILEIGSSYGNSIRPLLDLGSIDVSVIDPCIDADLFREFGAQIHLHKGLSLEILPHVEGSFDCIFIDGDHNWYTVFNELRIIEERNLLNPDGVIFLHDVAWPYGRRDMYYQPETVPPEYRRQLAKRGIEKGRSLLLETGGFNSGHYHSLEEGGEKNGVLTAVEDFLKQSHQQFYLIKDPREFGFAILMKKSARNDWRRARRLQARILKQLWFDPTLNALRSAVQQLRSSRAGKLARRVKNFAR